MTRRFAIALSFLLIQVVHCAADPLLRPRQGKTCTVNVSTISPVSCPTEDLGFYPLAKSISGPSYVHLQCYYPFVSHCRYNLVNLSSSRPGLIVLTRYPDDWSTVRDVNEGHCLSKAEICGSDCPPAYQCPPADDTMTPLDIASVHVPEDIILLLSHSHTAVYSGVFLQLLLGMSLFMTNCLANAHCTED